MSVNNDVSSLKSELRNHYRAKRAAISTRDRAVADAAIARRLCATSEYQHYDTLLVYVSTENEVDTHQIINAALNDGKRVAVPRCIDGTRDMEFYYISSLDELVRGSYGILEPMADSAHRFVDTASSVCVVPALSYDKDGYRLGYGGGYYDRFLAKYDGVTVGICYCDHVETTLPRDEYDRHVSILVTEQYVRNIRTEGE